MCQPRHLDCSWAEGHDSEALLVVVDVDQDVNPPPVDLCRHLGIGLPVHLQEAIVPDGLSYPPPEGPAVVAVERDGMGSDPSPVVPSEDRLNQMRRDMLPEVRHDVRDPHRRLLPRRQLDPFQVRVQKEARHLVVRMLSVRYGDLEHDLSPEGREERVVGVHSRQFALLQLRASGIEDAFEHDIAIIPVHLFLHGRVQVQYGLAAEGVQPEGVLVHLLGPDVVSILFQRVCQAHRAIEAAGIGIEHLL
eukprot:753106-Hanusia_phi.AAC.5